ncbi:MAG: polysaccharide deacetylase family protein [Chitinophagaceae bacterium]
MTFIAPHYNKARKKPVLGFFKRDRYLIRTPWWMKRLFPDCVWDIGQKEKTLYLTFDDGPHPSITPFVLEQLKQYQAKATFFCIGENVTKYPEVYKRLTGEGHAVGNHTQHHLNGWKTADERYLGDIEEAATAIHSPLFRPPYGRIKRSQIRQLHTTRPGTRIIMWNILPGDWDGTVSPETCYDRIKNRIREGDIIVFHDSDKAWDRMHYCLPRLLKDFSQKGYRFDLIPQTG